MTPGQRSFLRKRLRLAASKQPEIKLLRKVLLSVGGDEIVAPPGEFERDLEAIMRFGHVTAGPVRLKVMKTSNCHSNIWELWGKRTKGLVALCTGYALSADALWRQHSWGILREGVLETTEPRVKYFGFIYAPDRS
jgi:hypothetical protein